MAGESSVWQFPVSTSAPYLLCSCEIVQKGLLGCQARLQTITVHIFRNSGVGAVSTTKKSTRCDRGIFTEHSGAAAAHHPPSVSPAFVFTFRAPQVNAAAKVESEKRISLKFRSSQYLPQTLLGWDVSNTFPPLTINLPQLPGAGWVDTTFVDQDIRVARALGGNLFVLARV